MGEDQRSLDDVLSSVPSAVTEDDEDSPAAAVQPAPAPARSKPVRPTRLDLKSGPDLNWASTPAAAYEWLADQQVAF